METENVMMPPEDSGEVMPRQVPDSTPERDRAHVQAWNKRIDAAKKHFDDDFKNMRTCMHYVKTGASAEWGADKYRANIIQRVIGQKVAALYAKNPRVSARPRPRLEYTVWDGQAESLQAAMQTLAMNPGDPAAMEILMDVQQAKDHKQMIARLGKTLEILFHYFMDEQLPPFKRQAKQMVRRALTCGVAYVDLSYQRVMEPDPNITRSIRDTQDRINRLRSLVADAADLDISDDSAEMKDLEVMMETLQSQEMALIREGLTVDFPKSTDIIVDPNCTQLNGFVNANWICREYHMTVEEVQDKFEVALSKTQYQAYEGGVAVAGDKADGLVCVRQIQDIQHGVYLTVADGYEGYLKAPAAPDIDRERFFSIHALTFNDIEAEKSIYPLSDVSLIMGMQDEYNRSRQGLREHRLANRPKYVTSKGALSDDDKGKLENHPAHAVLELAALLPGTKVGDLLQRVETVPIDPALYDTNMVFDDVLRVVGSQEANLGGVSGATATESSIAEGSRVSSISSNVDDLDDMLTAFARDGGQIMLLEMDRQSVIEIAGPGAVWPELDREGVAKEIFLAVRAGSSGRPNRAAELANLERGLPYLLQVPGISAAWVGRKIIEALDDASLDLDEAMVDGMPSIIAQNQQAGSAQVSTGDAASDPASQGGAGADNAPRGQRNEPGGQPEYPGSVSG
jgi:hypothetical protein